MLGKHPQPQTTQLGHPTRIVPGRVETVDPDRWSVDVLPEGTDRIIEDVPVMSLYMHPNGSGLYYLPEEGTPGLHDLLLNLLFNAVDAMPEGGTITLCTQSVDGGVQLTVRDTGIGMEEETRRRVFEPFFTTKMDVGSGLGLSTVHGTVTRWGGHIEVESAPGQGTTFTLWFPAWSESEVQPQEAASTERLPVRGGRLLIVEDDEGTCGLLDRLLSETHEVETVLSGREALEQFTPGRYDVVLIDLGMPGLPGDRVAQQMQRIDPSVVTVLITGWELRPGDRRRAVFDFWIQKPFDDFDEVDWVVIRAIELHDARIQ